jgi:RimJ/RimL family protein N-acetyltransferase
MHVREIGDADAGTLFEMLRDPAVMAYMSSPPPSLSAFRGFIAWAQEERRLGQSICFGIVPPGLDAAVGIIQLRAQEPSWFTAEWGFAIGVSFWGTGAFADAAQAVAGYAFDHIGVHRLEARASMMNGRGNGVLQKLGARPEGALASAFARDGRYDSRFLWGLHVDDWRQRALFREPFSIAEAHASIAAAIQDTTRRLRAQRELDSHAPTPRPYPFFVTEPPPIK